MLTVQSSEILSSHNIFIHVLISVESRISIFSFIHVRRTKIILFNPLRTSDNIHIDICFWVLFIFLQDLLENFLENHKEMFPQYYIYGDVLADSNIQLHNSMLHMVKPILYG